MKVYKIYDKATDTFIKGESGKSTWDNLGSPRTVIAHRKRRKISIASLVIYQYTLVLEDVLPPTK